jgi:hypothetical protein
VRLTERGSGFACELLDHHLCLELEKVSRNDDDRSIDEVLIMYAPAESCLQFERGAGRQNSGALSILRMLSFFAVAGVSLSLPLGMKIAT